MLAKRIIPCLDCQDGRVVKGVRFESLRDAGDPAELADAYNREGADELVMLDISASREGRATLMDTVNRVARRLFIPLTVGGGVRSVDDARRLLAAGADKIAVNTAAVESPGLVSELAGRFGNQAIVIAIDARRDQEPKLEIGSLKSGNRNSAEQQPPVSNFRFPVSKDARSGEAAARWEVFTYGGTRPTGLDALEWARRVESLGAGEILLTSMDADGTEDGFDCALTAAVSGALRIPVIASGGAGGPEHFVEVFERGAADAALAASVFHFDQHTIRALKEFLRQKGVPVRM
jgi:imidazole glycerol-phosphate synthase subunit HisF